MISRVLVPGDRIVAWLGRCPSDWHFKPIKYLCALNARVLPEDTPAETEILYIDIGSVNSEGRWVPSGPMAFGDAPSRARRAVADGDVLISTVRTYLRAITSVGEVSGNLVCSTGFAVLSPSADVDAGFLSYWVRSDCFVDEVVARSVGVSYPAINSSDIGNLPFPILPIEQQRSVSAFLDRETARVDRLISMKERQIGLLQEKRSALISQVVTSGLDPNVKMKDSGVEWLGEIPEHWEMKRAKSLFREIDARSSTGQEELLTVSHITGVTARSEKNVTMFMAESLEGYKICCPGDLVINTMWAWMGAMGIARQPGVVSPSYNVYRLRSGAQEPDFYDCLFRTGRFISEVTRYSQGVWTSRLRLYPDEFFQIRLPSPPLAEQRRIVSRITEETGNFDVLTQKIEQSISGLREYRNSLVSAAVTGKIDLRGGAT